MYKTVVKPTLDCIVALGIFLILSPIFVITTVVLMVVQKGSPFFIQRRPGKNEQIFSIYKFRTMTNAKDQHGNLLPDEQRITGFGKFVRSTSIDEIPQLLNVIKGEMSIVGPRPLLPLYLPLYSNFQKRRHDVKPGITGWAQVNGRNNISWEKKFEMDVYYTEHINFLLDINILVKTIVKVIQRNDITAEGLQTTEAFKGNDYEN